MDDNKRNSDKNQPQDQIQENSFGQVPSQDNINSSDAPVPIENEANTNSQNNTQSEQNPIFESVPVEEPTQPEEVASEVTEASPGSVEASPELPPEVPPPVYQENKSKYLVIAAGVAVFLILFIIIIKTFLGGSKATQPVNLTYWGLWEEKEIVKPLIDQYQQKYPNVKIDYQKMSPQDYRDKLLARSKIGQGPDIFRFHNTWLPEIRDLAAPIPNSIMSNSEFESTFYKIHQRDLKDDTNHYYGIPLTIDGLVLVYNDDLLKKSGIQAPPSTWDDITNMLPKLTSKDKKGQFINTGLAIGTTSNVEHFSDIFALLLIQNGGSITALDSEEAIGALEVYRKFAESQNDFWNDSMPNSLTAFIQEKVAMILVPSWQILSIKNANPELKVKVVPVPAGPDGNPVSISNYWVEGVSKNSSNQLEAWKFLKYLVQKENLTKLFEITSQVRPFGEPYSRVDCASLLTQNEFLSPVIKQAEYYISVPMISRTFDNGLNDEVIKYIENAINASAQGVSYQEALKTAKQGVDQIFSKYKLISQPISN